jgi:hypothetical protein
MNNTWLLTYVALQQGPELEQVRRRRDAPVREQLRRRRGLPTR